MLIGAMLWVVARSRGIFILFVFAILIIIAQYTFFQNAMHAAQRNFRPPTLAIPEDNGSKATKNLRDYPDSKSANFGAQNVTMTPSINSSVSPFRNTSSSSAASPFWNTSSSTSTASRVWNTSSSSSLRSATPILSEKERRCREVRRRVSFGVVDYVRRDGDQELLELIQPMFTKKKLVVWSADHHPAPIADIRGLIEPLGVEVIEHTAYTHCDMMCTCDQMNHFPVFNLHTIIYLGRDVIDRFYRETLTDRDILRTDAFLVAYSIPIIELYERYNRSIIAVDAIRYERTLWYDSNRWRELNGRLRTLMADRRHVIGANSLYDVEYIYYFSGARPDYVPSFCAYTGSTAYNPTRDSFLYARRPNRQLGAYWKEPFDRYHRRINATFRIEEVKHKYKSYDFSDLASHLGFVHFPYQVSVMSFFEQYRMNIPIFAPSLDFLTRLHMEHYVVYDKTLHNHVRQSGSRIPVHPAYNGSARVMLSSNNDSFSNRSQPVRIATLDPNDDMNVRAVLHWLSLSDFYTFPHVVLFSSAEHLVDILNSLTHDGDIGIDASGNSRRWNGLWKISEAMKQLNRTQLKQLLRYWRMRLLDIAQRSPNAPFS